VIKWSLGFVGWLLNANALHRTLTGGPVGLVVRCWNYDDADDGTAETGTRTWAGSRTTVQSCYQCNGMGTSMRTRRIGDVVIICVIVDVISVCCRLVGLWTARCPVVSRSVGARVRDNKPPQQNPCDKTLQPLKHVLSKTRLISTSPGRRQLKG